MEPSTSRGRNALSGAVEPPAMVLVEMPRFDERDTSACIDLLTTTEPADEKLLIVSVTETIGKTHRRWDDHVGEHPAAFAVVSASFVEEGPGDRAPGDRGPGDRGRGDESPVGNRPGSGDTGSARTASEASWLTTHQVDDPGDLTGLGVTISSQLGEWAEDDEQAVLCFRSLTTTLQYVSTGELVRFLSELRKHVEAAGAIAHFHVDPEALDRQTLAAIRSVVDGVVVGDSGDGDVELLE